MQVGCSIQSSIDEPTFKIVNNTVLKLFSPKINNQLNSTIAIKELFHNFGGAFRVDSADKIYNQNHFVITLTGQVARFAHITKDAYAIVACHEMGHILGSSPRQTKSIKLWSSVEGQADYWATNKCMWKYIANTQSNQTFSERKLCQEAFESTPQKIMGCNRIITAIESMVQYFNSLNHQTSMIALNKKDTSTVSKTLETYPSLQCRIDTLKAGALDQDKPKCWYFNQQ